MIDIQKKIKEREQWLVDKMPLDRIESKLENIFYDYCKIYGLVKFEVNYQVGNYWIDFAWLDKKLAVELDGKQHNTEERKNKDKIKDDFLQKNGWKVVRYKVGGNLKKFILRLFENFFEERMEQIGFYNLLEDLKIKDYYFYNEYND